VYVVDVVLDYFWRDFFGVIYYQYIVDVPCVELCCWCLVCVSVVCFLGAASHGSLLLFPWLRFWEQAVGALPFCLFDRWPLRPGSTLFHFASLFLRSRNSHPSVALPLSAPWRRFVSSLLLVRNSSGRLRAGICFPGWCSVTKSSSSSHRLHRKNLCRQIRKVIGPDVKLLAI
jgi:hypothetical protein